MSKIDCNKRYYAKHKDACNIRRKNNRLKKEYGITTDILNHIIVAQDHRCVICGQQFKGIPHVDHNHTTGEVRELLCGLCNRGLGCFKDNAEILRKAAGYIDKWNKQE